MVNLPAFSRFLIFFGLILIGFLIESIILKLYYLLQGNHHKTHHYSLSKYFYFLLMPFGITVYYLKDLGTNVINIVIWFAIYMTLAEWIIGFAYHKIVGTRLWTYHRAAITSYTSFLSIPLWGLAGLIFYLFMQIFI